MPLSVAPPLGLYIHIPWCVRKCPYCDFNSYQAGQSGIPEKAYVAALLEDLANELLHVEQTELCSIFFGGGTPSLFSGAAIADILTGIEARISFAKNIEITLEANPGTTDQDKFADYRAAGVNRLSVGVQSFNDRQLKNLGRVHDSGAATQAVKVARRSGFTNINLDLMHGLPAQSQDEAMHDLQQAIDMQVPHISWYQLTMEPNTAFYKNPPPLPTEDTLADIQETGSQVLAAAGYQQYEISAFSQDKQQSTHNLNYWLFGDYIGIGAGAHGKRSNVNEDSVVRTWKTRSPVDYLNNDKPFLAGWRQLAKEELPVEFMMNALRLIDGCSLDLFKQRTGLTRDSIQPVWQRLQTKELLVKNPEWLQATAIGQRYLNEVLQEFIPGKIVTG